MADESVEQVPRFMPGEEEAISRVIEMAERYGYGNLMHRLSDAWVAMLARTGSPPGGGFAVGVCHGSLEARGFTGPNASLHLLEAYEALYEALERIGKRGEPMPRAFARAELKKVPRGR